ncbi:MAG: ABC transporter permease [Oscillospiraceae bacterium]|nr:ABC transporter permease [Oscillospiraceae bacterium]
MDKLFLNTLRSVKRTFGRFLAILAIIAISSAFYAGVKDCAPRLKDTAWRYCNNTALADVKLISTLGFDTQSLEYLYSFDNVSAAYAGYSADLYTDGVRGQAVVHLMSISPSMPLNTPYLTAGRIPKASGEILMDSRDSEDLHVNIGDRIRFSSPDSEKDIGDILSVKEFTVVGLAQSPLYITDNRGFTNVGSGKVTAFAYIPEEDFAYEAYTEIFLRLRGSADAEPFGDDYYELLDSGVTVFENRTEDILEVRRSTIREKASPDIAEAQQKLEDARAELEKGRQEYEDGKKKYLDGKKKLEKQEKEFRDAGGEALTLAEELQKNYDSMNMLAGTCRTVDDVVSGYENTFADPLPADLLEYFTTIQSLYDENNVEANIKEQLTIYVLTDPAKDPDQKAAAKTAIVAVNEQVRSASISTMSQLRTRMDTLNSQSGDMLATQQSIEDAKAELEEARKELEEAEKDLEDGEKEIEKHQTELDEKIAEMEDGISGGELIILPRDEWDPDCMSYGIDCDRVDSIADAFPIFFVLVAALVVSATMTRMVEEQRSEAGTLTALGYPTWRVISQYLIYAAAAALIGSVSGCLIGFRFIPRVIFDCYATMYNYPGFASSMDKVLMAECIIASLLCTVLSALIPCARELDGVPAALIRPKAPRSGKRILLERISFIWNKVSFLHKVSFRNLFRYKSRFFVMLIGIGGCTALLLTGFGLKYAVSAVLGDQFGRITLYSAAVSLDEDADDSARAHINDVISSIPEVTGFAEGVQRSSTATYHNKGEDVYIISAYELSDYIAMPSVHGGDLDPDALAENDVYITEKLSVLLGLKVGDPIRLDGLTDPFFVRGIAKNHINHYVYVSPETYSARFGEYIPDTILIRTASLPDKQRRGEITGELIACDGVLSAVFTEDGLSNFYSLLDSLDLIVAVIILFVGALSFVILLNLANINITERKRELAALKVLGFFDSEVSSYVYRENTLTTILGIILGLAVGIFFESFVIVTAETDSVMFMRDIAPWCFGASVLVMAVFVILVNIIVYFKLKRIDMTTSMKAIE